LEEDPRFHKNSSCKGLVINRRKVNLDWT